MAPAPRGTLPVRRRKEDVPLLVNGPHVAGGYGGTGRDVGLAVGAIMSGQRAAQEILALQAPR